MALNQRRLKILNLIREDGHAKVQDLSKIFKVTDVTIRQDLEELEKMGWNVITVWECELKKDNVEQTLEDLYAQITSKL